MRKRERVYLSSVLLVIVALILATNVISQELDNSDWLDTCETSELKLVVIGNQINKLNGNDNEAKLIIIGGSPRKINSRYNRLRIDDAIKYLTKHFNIEPAQIVWGIGNNSARHGYLSFYIQGVKKSQIRTAPKGKLCGALGKPILDASN